MAGVGARMVRGLGPGWALRHTRQETSPGGPRPDRPRDLPRVLGVLLLLALACAPVPGPSTSPTAQSGGVDAASAVLPIGPPAAASPQLSGGTCVVAGTPVPIPVPGPSPSPNAVHGVLGEAAPTSGVVWSLVATGQSAGVTIDLLLPKTTFVTGEAVTTQVRVHNDGPQSVTVWAPHVVAQNETGAPMDVTLVPNDVEVAGPGPIPRVLPPSASFSTYRTIQLPFENEQSGDTYTMSGVVQVDAPGTPLVYPSTGPPLSTTRFPLVLTPPSARERLDIQFAADQDQWRLVATDGNGEIPRVDLVAWLYGRVLQTLGPDASVGGILWAGSWAPPSLSGVSSSQLEIRVFGPGYVTADLTEPYP